MSDVFDPLFVECRTDARTLAMAIKGGGSLAQQEVRITDTSISLEINPVTVYKDIGITYSSLVELINVPVKSTRSLSTNLSLLIIHPLYHVDMFILLLLNSKS